MKSKPSKEEEMKNAYIFADFYDVIEALDARIVEAFTYNDNDIERYRKLMVRNNRSANDRL